MSETETKRKLGRPKTSPDRTPATWKAGGGSKPRDPNAPKNPNLSIPQRRLTDKRKAKFLKALAEFGTVTKAAQVTDGTSGTRRSYLVLASKDHVFKRQMEDALEAYSERVASVLREEFFEGTTVPIVSAGEIVKDESGKEVWIRKRDPKIVLALAKKHDFGLREIKTIVNVDGSPQADPNDPQIILKSSDLWRLDAADVATITRILAIIHKNRSEEMADITPRPEYLENHTIEDVDFKEIPAEHDEGGSDDQAG